VAADDHDFDNALPGDDADDTTSGSETRTAIVPSESDVLTAFVPSECDTAFGPSNANSVESLFSIVSPFFVIDVVLIALF